MWSFIQSVIRDDELNADVEVALRARPILDAKLGLLMEAADERPPKGGPDASEQGRSAVPVSGVRSRKCSEKAGVLGRMTTPGTAVNQSMRLAEESRCN